VRVARSIKPTSATVPPVDPSVRLRPGGPSPRIHPPLQVNSAVRTAEAQFQLRHHTANAAPEGETLRPIWPALPRSWPAGLRMPQQPVVVDYLKNFRDLDWARWPRNGASCSHFMVSNRYTIAGRPIKWVWINLYVNEANLSPSDCLALLSAAAFAQSHKLGRQPTLRSDPRFRDQSSIARGYPQRFLDESFDLAQTRRSPPAICISAGSKGNLSASFFSTGWNPPSRAVRHRAIDLSDSVYQQPRGIPDKMTMAFTADELCARNQPAQISPPAGLKAPRRLRTILACCASFYRLGVRLLTLTWSNTNEWGDSSGDITNPSVKHPAADRLPAKTSSAR